MENTLKKSFINKSLENSKRIMDSIIFNRYKSK